MRSVLQEEKECFVCKTNINLQDHHIFFGTSNRKQSEKYGMKVWLCQQHHTGTRGVHFNRDLDIRLKKYAQSYFEEYIGSRTEFIKVFGQSYL